MFKLSKESRPADRQRERGRGEVHVTESNYMEKEDVRS